MATALQNNVSTPTYTQDPVLVPNMSSGVIQAQPSTAGNATVTPIQLQQAKDYINDFSEAFPSATSTVSGSIANNDVVTITVTSKEFTGGTHAVTATAATSDTAAILAAKMAAAVVADATFEAVGLTAKASEAVFTLQWQGTEGAGEGGEGVTAAITATGSEVFTPSSLTLTAGSGVVVPRAGFNFLYNGQVMQFIQGRPVKVDLQLLAALQAAGMPID